jgi:hypothetical protein
MPSTYQPPMRLATFAALFVAFVLGAFVVIWVYDPPVAGDYEGFAEDLPAGASGPMRITLSEAAGLLTGRVTLPSVMVEGGGPLAGTLDGDRIVFVTIDPNGNKMTWTGRHSSKRLNGSYWWGELDEQGRQKIERLGRWSARTP